MFLGGAKDEHFSYFQSSCHKGQGCLHQKKIIFFKILMNFTYKNSYQPFDILIRPYFEAVYFLKLCLIFVCAFQICQNRYKNRFKSPFLISALICVSIYSNLAGASVAS
jgi:hypothetical protein